MVVAPELRGGCVKQYPYRTAVLGDIFLTLPREAMKDLEAQLAEASGRAVDNHTVYEIVQLHGTTYIMFSDHRVIFGRSIGEGRW